MSQRDQARKQQHFLLVAYPGQGHINPCLQLAKTLTNLGVRVTFSTAVSAHRRMFPGDPSFPVDNPSEPLLSYHPYSDGFDDGYDEQNGNFKEKVSSIVSISSETLHAVATTPGRPPITCIIYAIFSWAAAVAYRLGVPSVLYWIQPAATFALYHHYFQSYRELISSHTNDVDSSVFLELPGLPPLRPRDLPTILVGAGGSESAQNKMARSLFETTFDVVDKGRGEGRKPRVIVNTFDALERDAIEAMHETVELIPVGPVLPSVSPNRSHRKESEDDYMEWLDKWGEKSVIYLSFGSVFTVGRKQREELARALVECGRPFLWVVREETDRVEEEAEGERGKVVGWCNQVEVLKHKAVGCFVTHNGWNSTFEAICCGVPMVGIPQWWDQPTNARMAEGLWGVGLRAEVNEEGVVEGTELKRCLEAVMGDGEGAVEIRRRAEMWKEKAREAAKEGGPSDQNLKAFIAAIGSGL